MSDKECKCEIEPRCDYGPGSRMHYFPGMTLEAEDLLHDQAYHRLRHQRLNRHLHGWGILCGLKVVFCPDSCMVKVEPGAALDCDGRLIEVCRQVDVVNILDLCRQESCSEQMAAKDYCVVLKYHEAKASPRAQQGAGADGCETMCQPSMVREGFCIELMPGVHPCCKEGRDLPACDCGRLDQPTIQSAIEQLSQLCAAGDCPPCCGPCDILVLARIRIHCSQLQQGGQFKEIEADDDGRPYRRYAWTADRLTRLHQALLHLACSLKETVTVSLGGNVDSLGGFRGAYTWLSEGELELLNESFSDTHALVRGLRTPQQLREVHGATGIDQERLAKLAKISDAMRISGVGKGMGELIVEADYTLRSLRGCQAGKVEAALKATNAKNKLVNSAPKAQMIEGWIKEAEALEPGLEY